MSCTSQSNPASDPSPVNGPLATAAEVAAIATVPDAISSHPRLCSSVVGVGPSILSALCLSDPTGVNPFEPPACPLSVSTSERTHQINDAISVRCLACNVRCLLAVRPSAAACRPPLCRRSMEPPFGEEGGAPYYDALAAHQTRYTLSVIQYSSGAHDFVHPQQVLSAPTVYFLVL
ncbi:hypothetical protein ACLOJK_037834 [Asimina triloba]